MKPTSFSFLLLCLFALSLTACEDDDDPIITLDDDLPDNVAGLNFAEFDGGNINVLFDSLTNRLEANPNIGIVANLSHSDNARSAGLSLPDTRLVYFGNPNLGTPLMQVNQLAGLDLPQKMLVYTADDDDIIMAYNNTDYLARRYGVGAVSSLAMISNALEMFATDGGAESINTENADDIGLEQGIIIKTSAFSVDSTFARLEGAINGNTALTLLAQLDHQANAERVGLELRPTRLAVFGNPNLGTPLMQDERSIAIDLPQKMLIYQGVDDSVRVAYNDIRFLVDRHDIDEDLGQIATIEGALDMISNAITRE